MEDFASQLERANMLSAIAERIGFAVWQLQELEGVCATYLVLLTAAKPGMGLEAGLELEREAKKKTFGVLLKELKKAGLIGSTLEPTFDLLLNERNWLIHRSRADSRSAVHHDHDARQTIERVNRIAELALELLHEIEQKVVNFMSEKGVTEESVAEHMVRPRKEWHKSNAI